MLIGLVGCGGFGREIMPELMRILRRDNILSRLVFVETDLSAGREVNCYPVVTEAEFMLDVDADKHFNVAIANSQVREAIATRLKNSGATPMSSLSPVAHFYDANQIGEGATSSSDE